MMQRQCRICGEWKDRDKKFPKDKPKQRSLWCYRCKASYSMLQECSGAEVAKDWIISMQAWWDYKRKFAPADRLIQETIKETA